ncbi:6-phosphogluconolactonase [Dyadobacter tibetensis]|uniref:6-phosphogluconolactonase n=1 Tax=Dyadobacter tibetensis TaxID=1211851 RepID=UPI000471BB3D|nr:6-phosphogluconolactonase [Dyadobacter tibetensis]
MKMNIFENVTELNEALAQKIAVTIKEVVKEKDIFTIVLSGGSTPKQLFQLLAQEPYLSDIPWSKLHFFWGDERFVPYQDDRNNASMAYDELLSHVPIVPEQVHRMKTELSPAEAVADYTSILERYFGASGPTFDLVLLGMGDDGHTLSLFPGTAVIHEQNAWVQAFFLMAQDMYRITLTAPIVNRAQMVVFALAGAGKAPALKQVLEGETQLDLFPSQIIAPENGNLFWYVDQQAASELTLQ